MLKRKMFSDVRGKIFFISLLCLLQIFIISCSQVSTPQINTPVSAEGVVVVNSRDYPPACLKLINDAKKEIILMLYQVGYYDYYPGSDSNILVDAVLDAVKRGVAVEVIIDLSDWNDENLRKNTEVGTKFYNAGATVYYDTPKLTSHQKVLMVDDRYSVVASANWTHYSLRVNNEVGVVVDSKNFYKNLESYFEERKKEAYKYDGTEKSLPIKIPTPTPVPPNKTPYPPPSENERLKPAEKLVEKSAESVKLIANRDYAPAVIEAINNAKKSVTVVQMDANYYLVRPYHQKTDVVDKSESLSPTNDFLWALVDAKKRGVDVRAIFDIQEEKENVDEDYANRLIAHGIDVYYDNPKVTTHTKMLLIDDEITIVGSTNWSFNAVAEGNEVSVLIKSKDVASEYKKYIDALLVKSTKLEPAK